MVSRRWCWTLFGYGEDAITALWEPELRDRCRYLVFQEELCPTTGRAHLQGFCILRQPSRARGVSTVLGISGAHAEVARGTDEECIRYCKKQETRLRADAEPSEPLGPYSRSDAGQGHRSDWDGLRERLRSGASYEEVSDEHFGLWLRYERGIRSYRGIRVHRRAWPTGVSVFWGRTGSGKTRTAYQEAGDEAYWLPIGQGPIQWYDGYEGQEHVIMDDFYGNMRISQFLKLTDRYPLQVPIKGGFVNWCPRHIWITSNSDPESWWPDAPSEVRAAVRRRLTDIRHFDSPEPLTTERVVTSGNPTYPPDAPLPFPVHERVTWDPDGDKPPYDDLGYY